MGCGEPMGPGGLRGPCGQWRPRPQHELRARGTSARVGAPCRTRACGWNPASTSTTSRPLPISPSSGTRGPTNFGAAWRFAVSKMVGPWLLVGGATASSGGMDVGEGGAVLRANTRRPANMHHVAQEAFQGLVPLCMRGPDLVDFGATLSDLGQAFGLCRANVGSNLVNVNQFWSTPPQLWSICGCFLANFGRIRAKFSLISGQVWPFRRVCRIKFGRIAATPGRFRACVGRITQSKSGLFWAGFGRPWPNCGLTSVEIGRILPDIGRYQSKCGRFRARLADLGRIFPQFGQLWPKLDNFRPVSTPFGPTPTWIRPFGPSWAEPAFQDFAQPSFFLFPPRAARSALLVCSGFRNAKCAT